MIGWVSVRFLVKEIVQSEVLLPLRSLSKDTAAWSSAEAVRDVGTHAVQATTGKEL